MCWLPPDAAGWSERDRLLRRGCLESTWLCGACRADPANAGWCEGEREEADENVETRVVEQQRLRDAWDRPPIEVTDDVRLIAELVVGGVQEAVPRLDARGRRRGTYLRARAVGPRAIARLIGRDHWFVLRIMRRLTA